MVRPATINGNEWEQTGQDVMKDQDSAELSPQMIKTATDLLACKNEFDAPFHFAHECELFPKPGYDLCAFERLQSNEKMVWFTFENATAFLEEMNKVHVSVEDKMKLDSISETLDTKTNTEDQKIHSENARDGEDVDEMKPSSNDDDNSTIVSSSSSAVFELFDDVSMLTNEDSILSDDIVDAFDKELQTFDDISLLTDGTGEGNDAPAMIYSLEQFGFLESHLYKEQRDDIEDSFITSERIIYTALKDHNVLDFLSGVNYEEGFSPSDELRLV